ncbi:hypothetical protein EBU99_00665 [bacterium]|nr:hypothetical protein [bacterium]
MPARDQFLSNAAPGTAQTTRRGLIALALLIGGASGQSGFALNASTPVTNDAAQCRNIGLTLQSGKGQNQDLNLLGKSLEEFENAFATNNSEQFAAAVSPLLQKKKDELEKIFEGTVLEYDLKKARLQRNSIWELNAGLAPQPGRTLQCGEMAIQPVYGPSKQVAVIYSAFMGQNQTKILALFALPGQSTKEQKPGLVLFQVQRWTYDGRSPEKLISEAKQTSSAGFPIAAQLLSEAAARITESNPYLIFPLQKEARELATLLSKSGEPQQETILKSAQADPLWRAEKFAAVFKDSSLAVGLKIRMRKDFPLNEQTQKCLETGKKIFSVNSIWKTSFSGMECLPYKENEDMVKPPKGGSQYFPWAQIDPLPTK